MNRPHFAARLMFILLGLFVFVHIVLAQSGPNMQYGVVPSAAYDRYDIDTVNMDNGNVVLRIPLLSFPQLGKLSLSYSVVANVGPWEPSYSCTLDGSRCDYSYNRSLLSLPSLVNNSAMMIWGYPDITGECHGAAGGTGEVCEEFDHFKMGISDATGAFHPVYLNLNDPTELRATDGSGWLYKPGIAGGDYRPIPVGTQSHVYDAEGTDYLFTWNDILVSATDRDNNVINYPPNPAGTTLDSIKRSIPGLVPDTTEGCPAVSAPFQPLDSALTWTVPGPNGKPQTYKFCYAKIYIRTNFFGGSSCYTDGADNQTCWTETVKSDSALQSVVLPDKTYWAFTYDSADSSNPLSAGYANITSIHLPLGGTISYTYYPSSACYGGGMDGQPQTLAVQTRTVSDMNGHSYVWNYQFARPYDPGYVGNTVTDSNQNDTVYQYATSAYSGFQASPGVWVNCADREISRKYYQGTGSGRTLLKTVATDYYMAPEPTTAYGAPSAQYGNLFPSVITTTLTGGNATTERMGYNPDNFTAITRSCRVSDSDPQCQNSQSYIDGGTSNLIFGFPIHDEIDDAGGNLLRATDTTYKWVGLPEYLEANLLKSPMTITISDSTGQIAKTTITYDDPDYIATSIIGARPTSVTHWNDSGPSPITKTYWNSQGMVSKTKDAKDHTNLSYVYGPEYGGLFPTSITNALGQPTSYTYDHETGSVTSIKDPNNNTTTFTYYDSGRIEKIQYPPTQSGSGDTQYSYSVEQSAPTVGNLATITTSVKQTDSVSQTSALTVDGLGRVVHTSEGEIGSDTNYDGNNRVTYRSEPYVTTPVGYTSLGYDALGRLISSCHFPKNECQSRTYTGFDSELSDELQHKTKSTVDALGRLTDIFEDSAGANLHTQYTYNGRDDLTAVTQYGISSETHRVKNFTYDSLSRLKTSKTESGLICYGHGDGTDIGCQADGYDLNGNLIYKTDARGTLTSYSFDDLNRLLSKTYSGGSAAATRSACYQYDAATNGIGHLGSEWTQTGSCPSSPSDHPETRHTITIYDAMGRITEEQQCHRDKCSSPIVSAMRYDLAGNRTYYSNGIGAIALSPTYDSSGRLQTIGSSLYGPQLPSYPATLLSIDSYNPAGSINTMHFGPVLNVNRTYDDRLRITGQTVTHP